MLALESLLGAVRRIPRIYRDLGMRRTAPKGTLRPKYWEMSKIKQEKTRLFHQGAHFPRKKREEKNVDPEHSAYF